MPDKQSTDALTFRQFEHDGWQRVAGPYHDYFSSLTMQSIEALLDAVDARTPYSLLDIACGPGYLAEAARQRGATVTGIDFSSEMVSRARSLYAGIEFQEGDAEELRFENDSFDLAAMNFGLLHLDRPERALKEAFRVISPNGRFAFTVWAQASEAVGFSLALQAVEKHGDPKVALPPGPPFFRFSDRQESEKAMREAGFERVSVVTVPMVWQLEKPEDLFKAFFYGTPRTGGLLRAQSGEKLEEIKQAITVAARGYIADNTVRIPMASVVVSGVKTASL